MHTRHAIALVTIPVLAASVLLAGEPRRIAAVRVAVPPVIDGQLTDACWQAAAPASEFTLLGGKGPATEQTSFTVAFDDTALYLGITCRESQMDKLVAKQTDYGVAVCQDDCVEIFLDPNLDRFNYFHFVVNAKGAQFNESGDGAGVAADWNAVWQSVTACGVESWTAEIAIPFAALGLSKKVGDTWGLNVCRSAKPSRELSSWSPTGAKFAEPSGFGEVTGLVFERAPYFVTLGVTEWGAAIMGENAATVKVTNDGAADRDLSLRLTVTPANGAGVATEAPVGKLGPGSTLTVAVPYRIAVEGGNALAVEALDRAAGGRVCAATGGRLAVPAAAEFSIFKSFYRDDVVVRYHVNLQPAALARHQLVSAVFGAVPDAASIGARRVDQLATVSGELRFDTAALAPGDYRIRVDLADAAGASVYGKDLEFPVLRRPVERRHVDIDAENFIRVDGQRLFPLGIYASPGSDKGLSDLAAAGFTLFRMNVVSPAVTRIVLDKAKEHGLMAWISVSHLLDFSKDAERRRETLRSLAAVASAHPAMLMWESIDEPAWCKQDAAGLYEGYKFLRALDQHHPVWMNHAPRNPIWELAHFNRGADIAGCDIYPVPEPQSQSNLPNRTIHVVGDETDKSVATVNNEKPIIMVLQGFGWKELKGQRGAAAGAILPTFDESRFMAYDAIVHGARGISYWGTRYTEKPSPFYCELKALVSELRAMQPVLVAPIVSGAAAGSVTSPENAVQMMRRSLNNRTVVIAINTQKQERRAEFALPGMDVGAVRVLFEDRTIAGVDGRFSDTFGPYATHLYTDDATFTPQRLDFSAELAQPRREQPPTRVPGDLIVNGSFEAEAGDDSLMADGWGSHAPFMIQLSRDQAHAGSNSLQITGMGKDFTPLAVQHGISGLKPDGAYTLSAWVKTAPPGVEFRIYVEWRGYRNAVLPWTKGTGEWQRVEVPFKSEPSAVGTIYAVVQVRGDGTAWFDEVSLVETPFGLTDDKPVSSWTVGAPIVSYWAGPGFPGGAALDDAAAVQLTEGGWNLVWCHEKELDVVQRHGLRGLITSPLLKPAALDDPKQREALDAFILRVRQHPGLYAYHLVDEPSAGAFPALGKLVAYIRERDPAHLAYINLLPTYANNKQLGVEGGKVEAYTEHLRQYVETVRPSLLSYDHYQFTNSGDNADYFLNLALIRDQALAAGLPFLNIVQASCWVPGSAASPHSPRVPNGDEMRYLVYTTLAYGAQGISYYVYCYPKHEGGMAQADGTPTPLYHALKSLNREFVAIAKELQPLKSLGAFHAGMLPPGTVPLPADCAFGFDPTVPAVEYKPGSRVQGVLLSQFGAPDGTGGVTPHVLVVNLDYKAERVVGLQGPAPLDVFDAGSGQWAPAGGPRVELRLANGGGRLVRVSKQ